MSTDISKSFKDVFPGLTPEGELNDLIDSIEVEKVILNKASSVLKVYVVCSTWISKKNVFTLEKLIKDMLGQKELAVRIYERFNLSSQYDPEIFFDLYKESIRLEFSVRNKFLEQIFINSEFNFEDKNTLAASTADNMVSREFADEYRRRLEDIMNQRAGFAVNVDIRLVKEDIREDSTEDIEEEVKRVINENREAVKAARENETSGPEPAPSEGKNPRNRSRKKILSEGNVILGRSIPDDAVSIASVGDEPGRVVVKGQIFLTSEQQLKSGKIIFCVIFTDHTDSMKMKFFVEENEIDEYRKIFAKGISIKVSGFAAFDKYENETVIKNVSSIERIDDLFKKRMDTAKEKRIELHCHTNMSNMDAVSSAADIVNQAHEWGHRAIAITDHGVVQSFPDAMYACEKINKEDKDFKIIYGMEAYLVDDVKEIVFNAGEYSVNDPAVVFSTVTTGPSPEKNHIIELCAVRIEGGVITDRYNTFVNPKVPIPLSMESVTGITDEMVKDSPEIGEVIKRFAEFSEGAVLAAYNCEFEMTFINNACEKAGIELCNPWFDLETVAKMFVKGISGSKLQKFAKAMHVESRGSIRANDRADTMAEAYVKLVDILIKNNINRFGELNDKGATSRERILNLRYYHAIILAANETGRRNLYTLVSESHMNYYKKRPRVPRSLLIKYREGLILGSACSAGELYDAVLNGKSDTELAHIVNFYDYLEVQPIGNNNYLIGNSKYNVSSEDDLREINKRIVKLGDVFGKPVVATCDVHFLNPEDAIYREIIQDAQGYEDVTQPPLYLHTTEEMLEEFAYLGEEKAKEIVIDNTGLIADMCERVCPIYPDKCPPEIPNSDTDLYNICYEKAKSIYGDPLPDPVEKRLSKELNSIIKNGYAVMYIIARKLVQKSEEDGYVVGSRGSVGSSLVATMSSITEVNPLPPHYYCPKCHFADFDSDEVLAYKGRVGCDMPDRICPVCGEPLNKDGYDIPFETFLGFKGNKEPDIDLNFSGEEQTIAQNFTEEIFGKGQTFKAGTIGAVKDKTAIMYTLKYFEKRNENKKRSEIERIAAGCEGVRRTTGQHPGGVVVLPKGMDINWITPIQRPANDMNSDVITTHFKYHDYEKNLLKLDILGKDDPSMIRMLYDLTGIDPRTVPLDDKEVIELFTSTKPLGIEPSDIGGVKQGVLGIPEFGTGFVLQMLEDTHPASFTELVMISGLSHGTDVWLNNAQDLIREGKATLMTAICTRDDIMLYLIRQGIESETAFNIMERVRKGKIAKGDCSEWEGWKEDMLSHGVPDWYIGSCEKIKYMFPKAHAVAYVTMAFRISYFKINYPLAYYAAYFSIKAKSFSYEKMALGRTKLDQNIREIESKDKKSDAENAMLSDMFIVREMYARGFNFKKIDIYKAHAVKFTIWDGEIMPSLSSIAGLGANAAYQIMEAAAKGPFLSLEDFRNRSRVSSTIAEKLSDLEILKDMPESNQLSIFDSIMDLQTG